MNNWEREQAAVNARRLIEDINTASIDDLNDAGTSGAPTSATTFPPLYNFSHSLTVDSTAKGIRIRVHYLRLV